jgi:hypothetical protein
LTAFAEEIATCQSQNQARCTRPQRFHHQSTRRPMPYQSVRQKAIVAAQQGLRAASAFLVVGHVLFNAPLVDVEDPNFACYYWAKSRLKRIIGSLSLSLSSRKSIAGVLLPSNKLSLVILGQIPAREMNFSSKYRNSICNISLSVQRKNE